MTTKEIDPMLRVLLINWLEAVEAELNLEKPNMEMVIESIQMLIDELTLPDLFKAAKEIESVKEGSIRPQN